MSDLVFTIAIGGLCIQIAVLAAFYYAAFRRLFCPPDRNNFLPTLLFLLLFKVGFPIVFVAGWVKCHSRMLTSVMSSWTLTILVVAGCGIVISLIDNDHEEWQAAVSAIGSCVAALLCLWTLLPFFRVDDRIRSLCRDPTDANVARVVSLGPIALPHLRRLLGNQYVPLRQAVVACLEGIGSDACPLLEEAKFDEDPKVQSAAICAIDRIQGLS